MIIPYSAIPTMDDWWTLTRAFPAYRGLTLTPLKDYGYMAIMASLEDDSSVVRILEFGHGLGPTIDGASRSPLFERYHERETWGLDDDIGCWYFPTGAKWTEAHEKLRGLFPKTKFVRGLLGRKNDLPAGYFDAIVSTSVLEEVTDAELSAITRDAHRLLRPGGFFINSHDLYPGNRERIARVVGLHREVGFDLPPTLPTYDPDRVLLEPPPCVMLFYQGNSGEERRYMGHFSTLVTCARRQ